MLNCDAFDVACLGEVFHYDEMYRLVQLVQDRPHVLHAPPDKNMTIHKVDILGMGDCNSECSIVLGRFVILEQPDYNDEILLQTNLDYDLFAQAMGYHEPRNPSMTPRAKKNECRLPHPSSELRQEIHNETLVLQRIP